MVRDRAFLPLRSGRCGYPERGAGWGGQSPWDRTLTPTRNHLAYEDEDGLNSNLRIVPPNSFGLLHFKVKVYEVPEVTHAMKESGLSLLHKAQLLRGQ